ncbi:MAG: HAD family hydrolase [Treponema sp.]|nr:HAD family hydrolase [Treponema sp.]
MRAIVFDLGGTLMEYKGMHVSWVSNYKSCFEHADRKLSLGLSEGQIEGAVEILKKYNPRVNPREDDVDPMKIFSEICGLWKTDVDAGKIIEAFFEGMNLEPVIFEDSIPALKKLRGMGYRIAALTDVATGMPDEMHKGFVSPLLPYFDFYVSSLSCGFKKPNTRGMEEIADFFNSSPDDMIMVGDDLRDVQVAKRFGCKSVLIERKRTDNPPASLGQDYSIKSLWELVDLVAGVLEPKI